MCNGFRVKRVELFRAKVGIRCERVPPCKVGTLCKMSTPYKSKYTVLCVKIPVDTPGNIYSKSVWDVFNTQSYKAEINAQLKH
jgi:hypothetical protein